MVVYMFLSMDLLCTILVQFPRKRASTQRCREVRRKKRTQFNVGNSWSQGATVTTMQRNFRIIICVLTKALRASSGLRRTRPSSQLLASLLLASLPLFYEHKHHRITVTVTIKPGGMLFVVDHMAHDGTLFKPLHLQLQRRGRRS